MKRNIKNHPIIRANAVGAAKIDIKDIGWFIPHYIPNMENQQLVMEQIPDKLVIKLFHKQITTPHFINFKLVMLFVN